MVVSVRISLPEKLPQLVDRSFRYFWCTVRSASLHFSIKPKMLSRTIRPVIRSVSRYAESASAQARAYHEPAHFKPATMNDLPVPQGSWEADYSAKQRKYNLHLLMGVAFAAFTVVVAANSGLVVLNASVPKLKQ